MSPTLGIHASLAFAALVLGGSPPSSPAAPTAAATEYFSAVASIELGGPANLPACQSFTGLDVQPISPADCTVALVAEASKTNAVLTMLAPLHPPTGTRYDQQISKADLDLRAALETTAAAETQASKDLNGQANKSYYNDFQASNNGSIRIDDDVRVLAALAGLAGDTPKTSFLSTLSASDTFFFVAIALALAAGLGAIALIAVGSGVSRADAGTSPTVLPLTTGKQSGDKPISAARSLEALTRVAERALDRWEHPAKPSIWSQFRPALLNAVAFAAIGAPATAILGLFTRK